MLLISKLFEQKYNEGHERVLYPTSQFLAISKGLTISEAWGIIGVIASEWHYKCRDISLSTQNSLKLRFLK